MHACTYARTHAHTLHWTVTAHAHACTSVPFSWFPGSPCPVWRSCMHAHRGSLGKSHQRCCYQCYLQWEIRNTLQYVWPTKGHIQDTPRLPTHLHTYIHKLAWNMIQSIQFVGNCIQGVQTYVRTYIRRYRHMYIGSAGCVIVGKWRIRLTF